MPCEYSSKSMKRKELHRLSLRLKGEKDQVEKFSNLTSSQLEAIIGGSLFEWTIFPHWLGSNDEIYFNVHSSKSS